MMFLQTNSSYKLDTFFSTYEIQDKVIPYLKDKTTLANDKINVLYEIQYTEPLVGANISALLKMANMMYYFGQKRNLLSPI